MEYKRKHSIVQQNTLKFAIVYLNPQILVFFRYGKTSPQQIKCRFRIKIGSAAFEKHGGGGGGRHKLHPASYNVILGARTEQG